jgi:hypothetical protein
MALKKTEDRIIFDRAINHLKQNPNEHTFKAVKAVAQEFMLSENVSLSGSSFEPHTKHLGCGVYELSYKKKASASIKI